MYLRPAEVAAEFVRLLMAVAATGAAMVRPTTGSVCAEFDWDWRLD